MDIGTLSVGFAIGLVVSLAVDRLFYTRGGRYEKALVNAERRIDALQDELAAARFGAAPLAPSGDDPALAEQVRDLEAEIARLRARPALVEESPFLQAQLEARTRELEEAREETRAARAEAPDPQPSTPNEGEALAGLTAEIARQAGVQSAMQSELRKVLRDAEERQRVLETRLMEVESELATVRLEASPTDALLEQALADRDAQIRGLEALILRENGTEGSAEAAS